jgi:hypothetical protein
MKVLPLAVVVLMVVAFLAPIKVLGHCDGMDGPVVKAARKALETGNVQVVLIWVQKHDEPEVILAFQRTLSVRTLSSEARELADMYFFETVVRLHRAGEGEPYTGLKPAGRDLGPAIPAADKALDEGSVEALVHLLTRSVDDRLREQYKHVTDLKQFNPNDVEAGREYVQAYVHFIHYVERLYEAGTTEAHGHYPESTEQDDTSRPNH